MGANGALTGEGAMVELLDGEVDRQFRGRLQKFFLRRGCTAAAAQDLTQEVFLRVIAYQRSRRIANVQPFVFQTAANLLRDRAKSTRRWNVSSLQEEGATELPLVDFITPERIVEGRQD